MNETVQFNDDDHDHDDAHDGGGGWCGGEMSCGGHQLWNCNKGERELSDLLSDNDERNGGLHKNYTNIFGDDFQFQNHYIISFKLTNLVTILSTCGLLLW